MKLCLIVVTVCWSVALLGARKHTAWKTLVTWHCANMSLEASSWPSEAAPVPLPAPEADQPSEAFGPARQRFDQLLSGVTKPNGKLLALIVYFGCTLPEV